MRLHDVGRGRFHGRPGGDGQRHTTGDRQIAGHHRGGHGKREIAPQRSVEAGRERASEGHRSEIGSIRRAEARRAPLGEREVGRRSCIQWIGRGNRRQGGTGDVRGRVVPDVRESDIESAIVRSPNAVATVRRHDRVLQIDDGRANKRSQHHPRARAGMDGQVIEIELRAGGGHVDAVARGVVDDGVLGHRGATREVQPVGRPCEHTVGHRRRSGAHIDRCGLQRVCDHSGDRGRAPRLHPVDGVAHFEVGQHSDPTRSHVDAVPGVRRCAGIGHEHHGVRRGAGHIERTLDDEFDTAAVTARRRAVARREANLSTCLDGERRARQDRHITLDDPRTSRQVPRRVSEGSTRHVRSLRNGRDQVPQQHHHLPRSRAGSVYLDNRQESRTTRPHRFRNGTAGVRTVARGAPRTVLARSTFGLWSTCLPSGPVPVVPLRVSQAPRVRAFCLAGFDGAAA